MAHTGILTGLSLPAALTTVYTNPTADNRNRTVELRFSNIDGTTDASITSCVLIDVSDSNASRPILPVGVVVEAKDALMTKVVLNPGDYIRAQASAADDIYVLVTKILEEPA